MEKKESSLINMFLTLFVISLISALCLGMVYEVTKEPIKESKNKKTEEGLKQVLPKFDNAPNAEKWKVAVEGGDSLIFYPAKMGDETVGTGVMTATSGYSGKVTVIVGFLPDGTINKAQVLSHTETPGLGSKMGDDKFKTQFFGKNPKNYKLSVKKDGGDVDAITAATISSRAYSKALQIAYDAYMGSDAVSGATKKE